MMSSYFVRSAFAVSASALLLVGGVFPMLASAAPVTLFTDGFETGDLSAWENVNSAWGVTPTQANSGLYKARVRGESPVSGLLLDTTVSTVGYTTIALNFSFRAQGLTDLPSPEDEVYLEWSNNAGSSWTRIHTIDESSADDTWITKSIALPAGADNGSIMIRLTSMMNGISDRVFIDDVSVTGEATDTDTDTIPDVLDNCPLIANADQSDVDADTIGDLCDTETGPQSCTDDVDNDGNGLIDELDPACPSVVDTDGDSVYDPDDNCIYIPNFDQNDFDADGLGDVCDGPEIDLRMCRDDIDNDTDGFIDLADDDCVAFRPSIIVTKNLINNNGGTKSFADFLYSWTVGLSSAPFTMPAGNAWLTYSFLGDFSVTETPVIGYSTTYSPDCVGTLAINQNMSCLVTNNDIPVSSNALPSITLLGVTPVAISAGGVYVEAGASASDLEDGDLTASIVTTGTVNTAVDGAYVLTYSVTDLDGGTASTIRTVNVGTVVTPPSGGGSTNGGSSNSRGSGGGAPAPACADGSDNDNDGKADYPSDPDCVNSLDTDESTVTGSNGTSGSGTNSTSTGEVLGETTFEPALPPQCSEHISTFLRMGKKNDVEEVKKLQQLLNETLGTEIPVNGYFGSMTRNAVKKFQKQYHAEILQPWIDAGFSVSELKEGTGYVYKTTKRWINMMKCTGLVLPIPELEKPV